MMNAPGKNFLFVVGILYVVFSCLSILSIVPEVFAALGIFTFRGEVEPIRFLGAGILAAIFTLSGMLSSGWGLFVGIVAIKNCERLEKAGFVWAISIVALVLAAFNLFDVNDPFTFSTGGKALAILLMIGAYKNKKAYEELNKPKEEEENL